MINSREEQAMLSDAARLQRHIQAELSSSDLRIAVQSGMERGIRNSKRSALTTGSLFGLAAAAVIAILLFIIPIIHEEPRTALVPQTVNWGELQAFKELNTYDNDAATLESAIRNDYIQLINKSAEAQGYRITLNAVTADENKMTVLYTATTGEEQELYGVSSSKMYNIITQSYLTSSGGMGAHDKVLGQDNYHKFYGKTVIVLDRSKPFPKELQAEFQIASVNPGKMDDPKTGTILADMHYSPRLKISFTLDPKFKQTVTRILYPDKTIILDGHEVLLSKLELSPLMISARFTLKNPDENSWEARLKINEASLRTVIKSKTEDGVLEMPMVSGSGTENGFVRVYASNLLDNPESLIVELTTKTSDEAVKVNIDLSK
jgi:hypothetical protein